MSVLAYLGDEATSTAKAVLTVAGTGIVVAFGEAYAGLLSAALASAQKLPAAEIREELGVCATTAAPGLLAGAFLLLADLIGLTTRTAINGALWLGVLTLTLCSVVEARGSRRSLLVRWGSVAASVVLGVGIIVLKAQLH
ncbi:hypothetical protein [Actinomycetospora cinnamomea]|nr:hypothetical protein [Actinomycetospora cinnamomea]